MQPAIKFGTSGWRGIIAEDFTFENVRLATHAIASYLNDVRCHSDSPLYKRKPTMVMGHDTRFLGPEFTFAAAEILAQNGLDPLACKEPAPTPVIAHTIRQKKALGGINMTASHNPAQYQGLKFSASNGAAAPPEMTRKIESLISQLQSTHWSPKKISPVGSYSGKTINPKPAYFKQLRKLVDFDTIRKAKLEIGIELMYGTGKGYLDTLLQESGAKVTVFHPDPNPLFGGEHPEPNAHGMSQVRELILSGKAELGLGLDGDADRFGIVDKDGTWLSPNQILALSLYHLKSNRGWSGAVVRTIPTSHQVDAVAELLGVRVYETPVGFKYIGAKMESEPIIVGGEESGGLSVKGHVPEKDGILACLLMAELVAAEGKSLGKILRKLERQTGEFHTDRLNVSIPPDKKESLLRKLSNGLEKIGSFKVEKFITTDGFKFLLRNREWVAFRASGTEPLIRCYIEAKTDLHLKKLRRACISVLSS